jgi:hypothetical protein
VSARMVLVILVGLAATAAPAAAAPANHHRPGFKARYRGSGTYEVDLVSPTGVQGRVRAEFKWDLVTKRAPLRTQFLNFRPDRSRSSGTGTWSITSGSECSRSGDLKLLGNGGGLVDFNGPSADVLFFPAEGDFASTDPGGSGGSCDTKDFWLDWVKGFSQIGAAEQVDPLTSAFTIRSSKLKDSGSIEVATTNVEPAFPSLAPGSDCGFGIVGQTGTCAQSFAWRGRVTIRKAR